MLFCVPATSRYNTTSDDNLSILTTKVTEDKDPKISSTNIPFDDRISHDVKFEKQVHSAPSENKIAVKQKSSHYILATLLCTGHPNSKVYSGNFGIHLLMLPINRTIQILVFASLQKRILFLVYYPQIARYPRKRRMHNTLQTCNKQMHNGRAVQETDNGTVTTTLSPFPGIRNRIISVQDSTFPTDKNRISSTVAVDYVTSGLHINSRR